MTVPVSLQRFCDNQIAIAADFDCRSGIPCRFSPTPCQQTLASRPMKSPSSLCVHNGFTFSLPRPGKKSDLPEPHQLRRIIDGGNDLDALVVCLWTFGPIASPSIDHIEKLS
jgi:hypothetical protein